MREKPVRRHGTKQFAFDPVAGWKRPVFLVGRIRRKPLHRADYFAWNIRLLKRRIQLEAVPQFAEILGYRCGVVADAGDEPQPGDENSRHT